MGTNERKKRAFKRQELIILALVLLISGALLFYYQKDTAPRVEAHFVSPQGKNSSTFRLEIAATGAERRKGLMFRKPGELAADQGMIFIFPTEEQQSFWMENTYIPLDIIFIDSNFKVAGVVKNAIPLSKEQRQIDEKSIYVVELVAGTAEREGIAKGATLVVNSVLPVGR